MEWWASGLNDLYQRIADDLRQGRHVVWLFPRDVLPSDHVDHVVRTLRESLPVRMVSIAPDHRGTGLDVVRSIVESYHGHQSEVEVVVLESIEPLTSEWALAVAGALDTSGASRSAPSGMRLLVAAVGRARLIQRPLLHVSVRHFWGYRSPDLLRAILRWSGLLADVDPVYGAWCEAVWPEVATFDEGFATSLVRERVSPSSWHDALLRYAEQRGWNSPDFLGQLEDWRYCGIVGRDGDAADSPPAALARVWASGACEWVEGRGIELHSAVLARLGLASELEHRVWRGQLSYLMPSLDMARIVVSRRLTQQFREGWVRLAGLSDPRDIVSDTRGPVAELTVLAKVLRNGACSVPGKEKLRRDVEELKDARNELAHYRPLSWERFCAVIRALESVSHLGTARTRVVLVTPATPRR